MNTPEELKSQKNKNKVRTRRVWTRRLFRQRAAYTVEGRRLTRREEQVEGSSTARVHIVGTANCAKMKHATEISYSEHHHEREKRFVPTEM